MPPWRPRRKNEPFSLEIRPDRDYVLLKGTSVETRESTVLLTGNIVIKSSDECIAKNGVHLSFWGRLQASHTGTRPPNPNNPGPSIRNSRNIIERDQDLADPLTHLPVRTIKAGETVLPYRIELPGDISETIVGLKQTGVVYTMQAHLEKIVMRVFDVDVTSKKVKAARAIRVVRTLSDESRTELLDRAEQVGAWDPKCNYKFGSQSKAVPFGGEMCIDFELTPANPKITVGDIRIKIQERRKIKTWAPSPDAYPRHPESQKGWWVVEQQIVNKICSLSARSHQIDPVTQADMLSSRFWIELPSSMNKCRQTIDDNPDIQIRHEVYYEIELNNPDGHVSQVNAHHPIRIFISEHRPLNSNDCTESIRLSGNSLQSLQNTFQTVTQPPPLYDRHYLDELFDGGDMIAPQTPGTQSGAATPQFGSRSNSYGNLAAMFPEAQEPLPEDLSDRLAQHLHTSERAVSNLRSSESAEPSPDPSRNNSVAMPLSTSPENLTSASRPAAQATRTKWDMEALSRLSSYNTALRSTQPRSPENEPPSYEEATSRSHSPPSRKSS